jgi:hypothetical protein
MNTEKRELLCLCHCQEYNPGRGVVFQIRLQSFPSTFFPINSALIQMTFSVLLSELSEPSR